MLSRCAPNVGLAICALAWVGACRDWDQYEPVSTGGGAPAMTTSATGPGGTTAGTTTSNVGGMGTGGSGVGGSGGGAPLDCGKTDLLADDFESPSWDWRWNVSGQESVFTREAGDLVINLAEWDNGYQLDTGAGFDFTGRTVVLEVADPVPPGVVFWFNVAGNRDNYLEFGVGSNGELYYGYELAGSFFTFAADMLPPDEYRFWRFREADKIVYFDISNDGATWMERQSFDISSLFDPAYTFIYVGAWKPDTGVAEQVRLARVYTEEPGQSAVCPIDTLTDDFADGQRGPMWSMSWENSTCPIDESTGVFRAQCDPMADASSGYGSSSVYDLTANSVKVEIVNAPKSDSYAWMAFQVFRPETYSGYSFEVGNGYIEAYEILDGNWTYLEGATYDPQAGRFLRIREGAGQVYFEQSPDDVSYSEFLQRPVSFDLSKLRVYLIAGASTNASPETLSFDNLNLGP